MEQKVRNELYNRLSMRLQSYEQYRKNLLSQMLRSEIVLFLVFLILSFVYHKCSNLGFILLLIFIIDGVILIIIVARPFIENKTFKENIKSNCKCMIEIAFNLKFLNYEIFNITKLKQSNLFSRFNKLEVDDVYKSTYKGVEYKVQETELIAEGNKGYVTKFKGLVIGFNFNKNIIARTLIAPKSDSNIMNNINIKPMIIFWAISAIIVPFVIGFPFLNSQHPEIFFYSFISNLIFGPHTLVLLGLIIYVSFFAYKKLKKTELEDIVFNKDYMVQTENEVEARYLITTSFMTRFMALQKVFHTNKIKCSFFDNEVIFAIETNKDMFELGSLYHSLDNNNKDIKVFIDQIEAIQNMIEHFKLDEKTGL